MGAWHVDDDDSGRRIVIVGLCNTQIDLPGRMSTEVLQEILPDIRGSIKPKFPSQSREEPVPNAMSGLWKGTIFTHQRDLPFRILVKPGQDQGTARLGDRAEAPVTNLSLREGRLWGSFADDIGTDNVRHPHRLRFDLTLRSANVLDGPIASHSFPAGKIGDVLASFVSPKTLIFFVSYVRTELQINSP